MQIIKNSRLTGFTGAINTTTPNATVNIAQLLATVVSTDGDVVLSPKGTGAYILGNPPDNTTTGGQKRGQYALDLQLSRNSSAQVASGNYSVCIGSACRSSGNYSIAMGLAANASGANSCSIGENTTASNTNSFAFGNNSNSSGIGAISFGNYCSASAIRSVSIGDSCSSTGNYSFSLGLGAFANIQGKIAFSAGTESSTGDNQTGLLHLRNRTTDATPSVLTSDSGTLILTTNILQLNNRSSFLIEALVTGRTTDGAKQIGIKLTALAERGATASTTAIVGNQVKSIIANKGSVTWDANLIADTTRGGVYVQVTGEASTTIQWSATLISDENTY